MYYEIESQMELLDPSSEEYYFLWEELQTKQEIDSILERVALSPRANILDCGSGSGRHTKELQKRGFSAMGLDVMPEFDKDRYKAVEADFSALPFSNNTFDLITLLYSGHDLHTGTPLSEVSRTLKVGGSLVYTSTDGEKVRDRYILRGQRKGNLIYKSDEQYFEDTLVREDGILDLGSMVETTTFFTSSPKHGIYTSEHSKQLYRREEEKQLFKHYGLDLCESWGVYSSPETVVYPHTTAFYWAIKIQ